MSISVTIPLLNPNEPEAVLVSLAIVEGQYITKGDILCTLETTKTIADLAAEADGYVVGLSYITGQMLHAGDRLCYLAETPDWIPPQVVKEQSDQVVLTINDPTRNDIALPQGLRITQPALLLASQVNFNLTTLPIGPLVTESLVREIIIKASGLPLHPDDQICFNPTVIIIYGGGGHGKMLVDLVRALGTYQILGIVDDGMNSSKTVMGLPVLGGSDILSKFYTEGVHLAANGVGGIGNIAVRKRVFEIIAQAGFSCPTLIHPAAYIEPGVTLAPGAQVFAHAYVGSEVQVGYGCIISTGAIVSHDCILEDYTILSPGAILAGEVQVGEGALIGMSATINLQVKIGKNARVGNGATVKSDVGENGIVRAGTIWPA